MLFSSLTLGLGKAHRKLTARQLDALLLPILLGNAERAAGIAELCLHPCCEHRPFSSIPAAQTTYYFGQEQERDLSRASPRASDAAGALSQTSGAEGWLRVWDRF